MRAGTQGWAIKRTAGGGPLRPSMGGQAVRSRPWKASGDGFNSRTLHTNPTINYWASSHQWPIREPLPDCALERQRRARRVVHAARSPRVVALAEFGEAAGQVLDADVVIRADDALLRIEK